MDYLSFGCQLSAQNPMSRTIRGEGDCRNLWVKQAVPPKTQLWHILQKLIAACISNPILRATVSNGGGEALCIEAGRLRDFLAKGFHVPEVMAVNDQMMVITDLGPQLREVLDHTEDPAVRINLIKQAAANLALLHRSGLAHGRPYLRDMTWDGDRIGFLDLEENPEEVMPLLAAQARDIFIFLSASARFARDPSRPYSYHPALSNVLCEAYFGVAGHAAIPDLHRLILIMRPWRRLIEKAAWRHVGSDVRQACFAAKSLENYLQRKHPA